MRTSIRHLLFQAAFAALLAATPVRSENLLTLSEPASYELQAIGFVLDREAELRVEALGLESRRGRGFQLNWWGRDDDEDQFDVYAWILDAESREPVWVMRRDGSERQSGSLRSVTETLKLGPGRYEAYLFSGLTWLDEAREAERSGQGKDRETAPWWELFLNRTEQDLDELERDLRECHVKVSAPGLTRQDVPRFEVTGELSGALIRHAQLGDSELRVSGFELDKPTRLRVRALLEGEREGEEAADYGWIVDAATRELVWQASMRHSERGGGGSKNRLVDIERSFEPGRYLVYYGTDDSHSFDEFNANPPYDPLNWGITLLPGEGFDPQNFRTFPPAPPAEPLIDLSRAGDRAAHQRPFRLHRDGSLHVVALGEYAGGEFADQGWINDAAGKTVWEMTARNTRGAGGAQKNRMFDGLVRLAAGDYTLHYTSDDSHSYDEFNSAKPFEPQNWGVTLRPGPGFAPRDLELIARVAPRSDRGDVIAELIGVGNDDRQRRPFTLDQETVVQVYALGEGRRGTMYDYGWIVDEASGERVWVMQYGDTDHAGGADKNRRFEGEVRLPAGRYALVYETDGSHASHAWNAGSPRDPFHWGITLRRSR